MNQNHRSVTPSGLPMSNPAEVIELRPIDGGSVTPLFTNRSEPLSTPWGGVFPVPCGAKRHDVLCGRVTRVRLHHRVKSVRHSPACPCEAEIVGGDSGTQQWEHAAPVTRRIDPRIVMTRPSAETSKHDSNSRVRKNRPTSRFLHAPRGRLN